MHKDDKKLPKYNFEEMKAAATSEDPAVRKTVFSDYFERFNEFPSFLFDNEHGIDERLQRTIQDLKNDPAATDAIKKGVARLVERLPFAE